jgi:hypothetical protein
MALSPEAVAKEPDPDYHGGRLSKPARERRVGIPLTVEDGVERSRRRYYDRKGDWYEETILNPDGSVRHHQVQPLRQHQGHGSDNPKKGTWASVGSPARRMRCAHEGRTIGP